MNFDKEKEQGISRRSFLAGASAVALTVGGAGLAACAPNTTGGSSTGSSSTGSSSADSAQSGSKQSVNTSDLLERKWAFEIPPDQVSDDKIVETITADIIIIGSGMSGLCTAASAIEAGAEVIVVTAGSRPVSRGGSNFGIGTKYQKEMGLDVTPASINRFMRTIQHIGGLNVDERKWAKWINNSAESMDWMIDLMAANGLKVSLEYGYDDPDNILSCPPASHNFWNEENRFGAGTGAPLQAAAYASFFEKNGGMIYWNTTAKYLIRDDGNTGRVSAVISQRSETDEYVKFEARKAIVLATGDFTRDKDMMAKYAPDTYAKYKDVIPWGEVNYDVLMSFYGQYAGDGHKMALWVGAAWQKTYPVAPMEGLTIGPHPSHGDTTNFWGINLASDGKRFINECTNASYVASAVSKMVGDRVFYVWDAEYVKLHETWPHLGASIDGSNGIPANTQEQELAAWNKRAEDGRWMKADTIEDLLNQFEGLDVKTAKASIEAWNRYCEQGYDEEFQFNPTLLRPIKTAPFYGSFLDKEKAFNFLTMCGGVRTNADMQVCEEDDTPIKGLYCTGIMTGDFYANTYGFSIFGQNLGGVCCTLSYLLGRDLAKL